MKKKQRQRINTILTVIVLSLALTSWLVEQSGMLEQKATTTLPSSSATGTSVPTEALELPACHNGQPEQIIEHLAYTVSYNPEWRIPNWVAYQLTSHETNGAEERNNHFVPDPEVKRDAVVTSDYSRSGYDRGHMAPAADMRWSEQAMRESFYMTNICPQNHNNNAGDWKDLEEQARDWARQFDSIYIACGPIVEPDHATIGQARLIAVPSSFYKVFLRLTSDGRWTAIGFVMPNQAGSRPLLSYIHTIDEVEELTGIDFFPALPDEIENEIEARYDVADWTSKR